MTSAARECARRPDAPARLSPTMSSRKLIALDFIKRYFARWGHSPTLGEIAAAMDVSSKRAHDLVRQLAAEKMIEHVAGKTRGIRLVEKAEELSEADVLARLSALGWTVGDGARLIEPPPGCPPGAEPNAKACASGAPLTDKGLPLLPILDFKGHEADGAIHPPNRTAPSAGKKPGAGTSGEKHQD